MLSSNVWLPIVTLLTGALLAGGAGWLRDRRAWARAREDRADDRLVRAAEFQRQTILSLQEALQKVGRAEGRMSHEDHMAFKETQRWGENLHSPDASINAGAAMQDLQMLRSRIIDGEVRRLAARLAELFADELTASSREQRLSRGS